MVLVLCDSRGIWVASLTPLLRHFPLNTPTSLVVSQQRLLQLDDGDMLSDLFCIPHTSSLLCVVSSDSLVRLVSLDSHSLEPFDSIVLPQPDACCLCARLLPSSEDDATSGGTLLLGSVDFERTCGYLSVVRVCQFVEEVTKVRTSGAVTDVAFGEKGRSIIACCGTNVCVYHLHSDRLLLVAEYNCGVLCTSVAVVRNVVSVGLEDTSHVFFSLSANDLLARIGDDYRSSTLQGEYFGNLARVGADGGVLLSSLGYPTPKPTTAEYPAVGLKGVVDVCLLHAFRLPSPCAKVTKLPTVSAFRSNQLSFRLCGQEARFNSPPDSMYMACRDGSLFAAREIPFAFSNPLSRLGKCISDFFPYSLVLCRCDEAEGGIARRFRGVPQDRVLPARQGGEYLRPQGVLDMRLFDELNVLRSLELSELLEDEVNPIKDKLAALGYAMEEITFQEYSNNLSVLDCIQMLNCV
ncbi:CPSF A subunit region containing protein, putative [Angomonas deanei]|uniref:CPSF A subunit region containing protein, putative n=1 Tax=Angomonas deanei TaxID=59799 RepID=A0A7G2CNN3_9TRYP|nr:CPSF A subunit region containing protein, putative [Angomonas deanei]